MHVEGHLGRRVPPDFEHVSKYPLKAIAVGAPPSVERILALPTWHRTHDQGAEGSCVGHAIAMERAITNTAQNLLLRLLLPGRRYDPLHIWNEAKRIDVWPDTNPGDDNGTSMRAGYDVARDQGLRAVPANGVRTPPGSRPIVDERRAKPPSMAEGIAANRWATTVDEIRASIARGVPVAIGVNWYSGADRPERIGRADDYRILATPSSWGRVRGGHAVALYGASDRRGCFRLKNSWGMKYPQVWLPYEAMQRLLDEDGEAAVVTDR